MKKETVFKLISVLVGLVLSLIIAEGAVRVYLFKGAAFSYSRMNSLVQLNQTSLSQAAENSDILYEFKPNQDDFFRMVGMKTNSFGHRDKEYSLTKPSGAIRGAFIGDSYMMGASIEMEDIFHTQMENRLNEHSDDMAYEFINFGVWGYNLLNYWGVLKEKVLQFDPDFIVIGFCSLNDAKLPNKNHYRGKFRLKANPENIFFKCYIKELWDKAKKGERVRRIRPIRPDQEAWVDEMFANYSAFSKENQVPIIIDYLSILESDKNLEAIKDLAIKNDLYFVDAGNRFNSEHVKSYRINVFDGHPNEKANDIFAEVLLEYQPLLDIIAERKKVILSETSD